MVFVILAGVGLVLALLYLVRRGIRAAKRGDCRGCPYAGQCAARGTCQRDP